MSVTVLNKNNFEAEVMQAGMPVLVDFWAPWCGPCKMLSPIVDQLAQELSDIKVCKVNIDDEPELATRFSVMSIPTLMVVKNGKVADRAEGLRPKAAILKMLGK